MMAAPDWGEVQHAEVRYSTAKARYGDDAPRTVQRKAAMLRLYHRWLAEHQPEWLEDRRRNGTA